MVKLGTREEWAKRPIDLIGKEDCPLCTHTGHKENILWEGEKWFIVINPHPYTGDEFHLMAFPRSHKEFSHELSAEEFIDLEKVYIFIKDYFGVKEYFSFTRETFGSRSIKHLHMHFIRGRISAEDILHSIESFESRK